MVTWYAKSGGRNAIGVNGLGGLDETLARSTIVVVFAMANRACEVGKLDFVASVRQQIYELVSLNLFHLVRALLYLLFIAVFDCPLISIISMELGLGWVRGEAED